MRKAISFSLFGYGKPTPDNSFEFNSYLRGLHINIRFNRILYPGWVNVLNIDGSTYESEFHQIFKWHEEHGFLQVNICEENQPLCKAMLWRMKPVFFYTHPEWDYSHVLCRDLDSIATYREIQMVQEWVNEDKAIHCITDSVSHNIPMMGGMVGFRPDYLSMRMGVSTWDDLMAMAGSIDFNVKGADQTFLNRVVYPRCADSATEHFIKGMVHNLPEGNGRHYKVNEEIRVGDVDPRFSETSLFCGHVGSAGFYDAPTMKFLHYEDPYREDYKDLESIKRFNKIFYWG